MCSHTNVTFFFADPIMKHTAVTSKRARPFANALNILWIDCGTVTLATSKGS